MPEVSSSLLTVRGLVKAYGGKRVVDGLDLDVNSGGVLGLLGPNGAGKTTTLRMLYGFVEPDAGEIRYAGKELRHHRDELKGWIGVCTQHDTLDHDFTVEQNLRVYANYFRPQVTEVQRRVAELLDMFGLTEYAKRPPRSLSGGFQRRLMIARSIVHKPRVLFLDEPTTGLDPAARVDVWRLVSHLRASGMAIILTTHYMDEAERLSDSINVLARGKTVARGAPRDILGQILGEHVAVLPVEGVDEAIVRTWVQENLGTSPARVLDEWQIPLPASKLAAFSEKFSAQRYLLRQPTLDDLFLHLAVEAGEPEATTATPSAVWGGS